MNMTVKPYWQTFNRINTRINEPERLDLGDATESQIVQSLAEMWRINRYLGGLRALTMHLYPLLSNLQRTQKRTITILDLGTGSAEIPCAIVRWAKQHGIQVHMIAVDLLPRHLRVAQKTIAHTPEITLLCADVNHLPFRPQSFDFVISSLFLHHFAPEVLKTLLNKASAIARYGLVMNDLARGWLPLVAFKLIQPIFARCEVTRHDGELSVRRAYTPNELQVIARAACLPNACIHTHFPWRMTLTTNTPIGVSV
jgi:SAM-dependent methyltransferase